MQKPGDTDEAPHGETPPPELIGAAHRLIVFDDMGPLNRSIMDDARAATRRIWIETYIYRDDRMGRSFGKEMAAAAARGADVRLLYDPLGSQKTDAGFFEELAATGVKVRPYRPASVVAASMSFGPRSHSRIVVIDESAYTGGAAWGDQWLPRAQGGEGWHDVCSRVTGPCVGDFARAYLFRWEEALDASDAPDDYATHASYPDLEFVTDAPGGEREVYRRYRERIQRARDRVWLSNSYFFPPRDLLGDLYAAADRGVDVKIILPAESDLPSIKHAARAEAADWIAHGLSLFEYQGAMNHSKYAVIDDDWATIGTFNLNIASLRFSNETNLFLLDGRFVARAAEVFARDLSRSTRLTPKTLPARGVLTRAGDALARRSLRLLEAALE
jgi:cardiolipin synthase A/B